MQRTGLSVDGATLELRLMLLGSITSVYALAFSPSVDTLVGDVLAAFVALRLAGMADSSACANDALNGQNRTDGYLTQQREDNKWTFTMIEYSNTAVVLCGVLFFSCTNLILCT